MKTLSDIFDITDDVCQLGQMADIYKEKGIFG